MSEVFDLLDPPGGLRETLESACREEGCPAGKMTVLAAQNDPFRVDTPARHRDGEWLAVCAQELGLGDRKIHLRGLHYMLVSGEVIKPNGKPYTNTDEDWKWLSEHAAKAARWLRYLPFEQVRDNRSSPPVIRPFERIEPSPYLSTGVEVEIPDPRDVAPTVGVAHFTGVQPYKLVLYGEKSSLEDVLAPIAWDREADLYLPAGEISDTLLHTMAKIGALDGRPMVVLTISDCDPAGWQMPISIGRKLQAFKALEFPDLRFQVHRVALSPDQVREYGLPSTPLKETERRADRWQAAKGVSQTEIDALAALRPDLLERIVRQAISPFFDAYLDSRVRDARHAWQVKAQARLEEQLDQETLDRIQDDASEKLGNLREEIDNINAALYVEVRDIELPPIVVPGPELDGVAHPEPLIDSDWSWVEQTEKLKVSKAY